MRLVADLRAEAAGEDLALAYARAWETARRIFDRPAPLGA
jgi:hypothetical protein